MYSCNYKRSLSNRYIRNDGEVINFVVFYTNKNGPNQNFDMDINDKGYLYINHKRYQAEHADATYLFREVFDVLSEGKEASDGKNQADNR